MTESNPLDERPILDQLGERVARILEREAGERGDKPRSRRRPRAIGRSTPLGFAPGLDRQGELGLPEEERAEEGEIDVVPSLQPRDQPGQPGNPAEAGRSWPCKASLSARSRGDSNGSRSILASRPARVLNSPDRSSTSVQARFARLANHESDDALRPTSRPRNGPIAPGRPESQPTAATRVDPATRPISPRDEDRGAFPRVSTPFGQRLGGDARPDVVAEQGEVFAKVEPGAKLADRLLPLDDLGIEAGRSSQAPGRPRPKTSEPCRAARKSDPFAKEVEVARIRVLLVEEANSRHARRRPSDRRAWPALARDRPTFPRRVASRA